MQEGEQPPEAPAELLAEHDRLYVRQREWEAAQTVWLWIDRSASMGFMSSLARASKIERAVVVGFAISEILIEFAEQARPSHLS